MTNLHIIAIWSDSPLAPDQQSYRIGSGSEIALGYGSAVATKKADVPEVILKVRVSTNQPRRIGLSSIASLHHDSHDSQPKQNCKDCK